MRFMQIESVLQTKNRSEPAKNRFSVALLHIIYTIRTPDKLLFGVKYSIILSKNQLSFKRWGTITQLIDKVPYLFLTSGVNLKSFSVRKA